MMIGKTVCKARGPVARALLSCTPFLALAACGDTQNAEEVAANSVNVATAPVPDAGPVELEGPPTSAEPTDCNALRAGQYVGQEADAQTRGELLGAVAPVTDVRWINPGEATTDDLKPDRLNIALDAGGVIIGASCG